MYDENTMWYHTINSNRGNQNRTTMSSILTKKRPHPENEEEREGKINQPCEGNKEENSNNDSNIKNDESNNMKPDWKQQLEAITPDGEMPQKRFYRSRAHCNPLSHNDAFDYPTSPDLIDWSVDHYPNYVSKQDVPTTITTATTTTATAIATATTTTTTTTTTEETTPTSILPNILDIGCGFGGLTTALSSILPNKLILGLEIRAKVTEYVRLRILALRKEHPGQYENCSVLRSNTMKLMPHFFHQHSLEKIFFCFPDPHFKKKNHSRRIVSSALLSEYAYFLKDGGKLYTITDVEDLHNWHLHHCRSHPMFRELSVVEMEDDPCVKAMYNETEEGKKVARAGTNKYYAVFEKVKYETVGQEYAVTADNFWDEDQFGVVVK